MLTGHRVRVVRMSYEAWDIDPPDIRTRPGDTAALDLRTGTWMPLPRSPRTGLGEEGLVWAGDRLILWGGLGPSCTGREDICPEGIALAGGIELAPPG